MIFNHFLCDIAQWRQQLNSPRGDRRRHERISIHSVKLRKKISRKLHSGQIKFPPTICVFFHFKDSPFKDSIESCRLGAASRRRPQSRVISYTIDVAATRHEIGFDSEQLRHARELVLRYGWNATAYQIINPGIELWFSTRLCHGAPRFRARRILSGCVGCFRGRKRTANASTTLTGWTHLKRNSSARRLTAKALRRLPGRCINADITT